MRRISRGSLPMKTQNYLIRKQRELDADAVVSPETSWVHARKNKALKRLVDVLIEMSGKRARCMYCDDSRGTSIEHFWPKSRYREKCFLWENMLLLCQGCQNHKGNRFDLDQAGLPLLIDPTVEDPWDHLFFEAGTGILTGRYDGKTHQPSEKGLHTTRSDILPLNIEAVTEGRLRTKRNLQRAVRDFTGHVEQGRNMAEAENELVEAVRDNDDYGLAVWFFIRDGQKDRPFADLKTNWPKVWTCVQKAVASC